MVVYIVRKSSNTASNLKVFPFNVHRHWQAGIFYACALMAWGKGAYVNVSREGIDAIDFSWNPDGIKRINEYHVSKISRIWYHINAVLK